jgi:cell division protein FtsB
MDWIQFGLFCVANIGLFIWNRTESRSDNRHMDAKLEAALTAMNANVQAIQAEIKDFHGRLCTLEERNRK